MGSAHKRSLFSCHLYHVTALSLSSAPGPEQRRIVLLFAGHPNKAQMVQSLLSLVPADLPALDMFSLPSPATGSYLLISIYHPLHLFP